MSYAGRLLTVAYLAITGLIMTGCENTSSSYGVGKNRKALISMRRRTEPRSVFPSISYDEKGVASFAGYKFEDIHLAHNVRDKLWRVGVRSKESITQLLGSMDIASPRGLIDRAEAAPYLRK
jgi:hypothetical protein